MRKLITMLVFITCLSSCNTKSNIMIGDLCFKQIQFGDIFKKTDKEIDDFEKKIDSLSSDNTLSEKDKLVFLELKKMKNLNLLKTPNIKLKVGENVNTVFLSETQYEKVKDFTLNKLSRANKKVVIELEYEELEDNIYFSDKIIQVKIVDGKTPWEK